MASADTFHITVHGRQTHGARPWDGVDPIVIGAQVVSALQTIQSRQVNADDASVLTVGVFQGGNRKRALPAIRLRDVSPPRRLRPVRSPLHPLVQVLDPPIKVCLVGLPRQPVHARRGIPLERVECQAKHGHAEVVEERGEPLLLPSCRLPYAVQRL